MVDDNSSGDTGMTGVISEDTASVTLFEFAPQSELAVLHVLEIFSDGYTKPILG